MAHEFDLIQNIRRRTPTHPRLLVGIGDDAAVLDWSQASQSLVTVDMLMEGIDFRLESATPEQIGYKALAVNLSDIAAMAGKPVACVVAVALPRDRDLDFAQRIHAGMVALAREFDVALAGGDTNSWNGPLVISITLFGEPTGSGPVLRSGAQPGDAILVTGELGGSILGRHLEFTPRVVEAQTLHASCVLHSLIDISDGLTADLGHILEESQRDGESLGAILDESSIPISAAAGILSRTGHPDSSLSNTRDSTPLVHALSDGEDFELIMTMPQADADRVLAAPPFATRLTQIGQITGEPGVFLRTSAGTLHSLATSGWKHSIGSSADHVSGND